MPRVPAYDNLQTQVSAQPAATFQTPRGPAPGAIGAEQASNLGGALSRAGGEVGKLALEAAEQANQVRVSDAMNKAMAARLKLTYDPNEGFTQRRGQAALDPDADGKSLDESYSNRLKTQIESIAGGLGNERQRLMFTNQANQMMGQFQSGITQHVAKEYTDHAIGVQGGTVKLAQDQMGLAWGDVDAVTQSRHAIKAATAEEGRLRGWAPQLIEAATVEQLSKGHQAVVLSALQAGKSEYAAEYMKQVSPELTDEARLRLTGQVKDVDVLVRGDKAADEAWASMAPAGPNDPVRIYDMEQALRTKYQGEPKLRDAALTSLKQRASSFNAQQTEVNAGGINQIYGMIDSGMPLSRVKSSPAWLGLPEAKRHEITKGLESEAATRAARGAADASRQVSQLQAADRMSLLRNGGDYLRDSDPDVLASMSRTQVEALRTKYGFDGTKELVKAWEQVQTHDGKLAAKIDKATFESAAKTTLGIDPASKSSKAQLGALKNRIDGMLQNAAQQLRRPLTTDEKTEFMEQEMAKTVTVDGWIWNSDKPAAALTPAQAAKVVVPQADKERLAAQMQRVFTATQDPDFAPTEANLRRLYLKGVSPISGLPDGK